jgi:GNAT superfamily N-acetyltransferase
VTASPASKDLFARAKGPPFKTKLSLWVPEADSDAGKRLAAVRWVATAIPVRLPQGLTFSTARGLLTLSPHPGRWSMGFGPAHPSAVYQQLTECLPTPSAVRVAVKATGTVTYHLVVGEALYARRWFDRKKRSAYHDLLMIVRPHRAAGLGAHVLANALALYRTLGITKVELTAGLSDGSAYWPRLGFRPVDAQEWDALRARLKVKLGTYSSRSRACSLALEPLNCRDPTAIWQLVRIEEPGFALGSALLRGERWRGMLDLEDPLALDQLRLRLAKHGRTV